MDFLKSAVASAIAKGPPFPYTFGDRVDLDQSIWALYNGTRREDGSNCSIFSFDVTNNKSRLPLARNAVRKLRTLRHPGVIKVLDTVETETYIYIATERLTPLIWHVRRKSLSAETLKWGICAIAKTVKFINDDASSIHGNLRVSSIYTSESGEWKLGGFEILSSLKDDDAVIYTYGDAVPESNRYAPPEVSRGGWGAIKKGSVSAVDAYNFGILIFEAFNGSFAGGEQAGQTKGIPPTMQQSYKRLTNSNPKARSSVGNFLEQGKRNGGFFETPIIKLTDGIDSLGLKSESEREEFLSELDDVSEDFPEDYFKMKVLPELLKSVEFGGGGPKVFGVVMKIGAKLTDDEYNTQITPVVVRLFQNPDRAVRVCLLDNLPLMIDRLPQKVVNDKIFPQMVTGFTDVAPLVREQTVKAVLTIIVKLSDRIINGELLKYLAKAANDEQPGIRTNTTICLGKIAKNLGANTRQKVLAAAFTRALRDPFVHARNAGLMALGATLDVFSDEQCASQILPALCSSLVDKEIVVRDSANKTLDVYLTRVRKYASTMPETALPPPNSAEANAGAGGHAAPPRMSTPGQNDVAGGGWAGWAISNFTNKIAAATGDISTSTAASSARANGSLSTTHLNPNPASKTERSTSAPAASETRKSLANTTTASASSLHRKALASPSIPSTRSASPSNLFDADELYGVEADAWGEIGDDSFFNDGDNDDAGSTPATSPKPKTAKTNVAAAAYDDGGEPDFAGWLAAQNQAKLKPKSKPLPKGLGLNAKSTAAARPAAVRSSVSTGSIGKAAATVVRPKVEAATATATATATAAPKKKEEKWEEDDGWGDGW